jgi:outer membrane protein TolC
MTARRVEWAVLLVGIAACVCAPQAARGQSAGAAPAASLTAPRLEAPPLPAATAGVVPVDREITLDEAIAIALAHQPGLALARYNAEAARYRVREAASALYPSLSISGQHTHTGPGATGTGSVGGVLTTGGYTTNFSARELIYDFGRTPASVSQARRQAESADQAFEQALLDAVSQVKQGYYTLLQDQALVTVQQQTVDDQRAHLALAQARFQAGVAARVDVASAEAAVAGAILNLATAENTAATARVALNLALGVDVRTPTRVKEAQEPEPPVMDAAALVEQALERRPAVRQARADVEAARSSIRVARANNLPSLSLDGNYGLRGSSFPPTDESWAYGVSLSWPIGDVGLTSGRIGEAEVNLLVAETSLRQTEQTVGSEVVQAYLNVQTAHQKVSTSETEVVSAEESLRLATGRYQAGVATYLEVLDAETAATTARTNLVNARYALSTSLAALAAALGAETIKQETTPAAPGG